MKKFYKYIIAAASLAFLMPVTACSDSAEPDPYDINYLYLRQPNDTYASVEYKANGDFLSGLTDPLELVNVRLTKPAPSDTEVEIAVDPSLVDEYNKANGTDYVLLKGAEILNPKLMIKQGNYQSEDRIRIGFTDHSGFINATGNLILPVVIRSNNPALTVSKSARIFLTFNSTYRANVVRVDDYTVNVDPETAGWEAAFNNVTVTDFLSASWAADDPVAVSVSIDGSLIDEYNRVNGTAYKPIEASLGSPVLNIAKGQKSADLSLKLGDYAGVAQEMEYIIPVRLKMTEGRGAELTKEVVYIIVSGAKPTVSYVSALPAGLNQITPGAAWQITGAYPDYYDYNVILTGDNYVWMGDGDSLTIDFGAATKVHTFCFQFYSKSYAAKGLSSVEVSNDGKSWKSFGGCEFTSKVQRAYVSFSKPVTTRYIRMTITEGYQSNNTFPTGWFFYN